MGLMDLGWGRRSTSVASCTSGLGQPDCVTRHLSSGRTERSGAALDTGLRRYDVLLVASGTVDSGLRGTPRVWRLKRGCGLAFAKWGLRVRGRRGRRLGRWGWG